MTNKNGIFVLGHAHTLLITLFLGIALLALVPLILLLPEVDQPALTAPFVCLSIMFTFFLCVLLARNRLDGKVDWFHPSILLMLVYLTYIMFSGVWLWLYHDYDSIWVDFGRQPAFIVNTVFSLGVVSIASFGMGMSFRLTFPGKAIRELFYQNTQFDKKEMRSLILLFLVIGGAFKLYHLSLFGSQITDIFRYLSPSASRDLGISISQAIVMFESMLDWAVLLAVFYYIVRYKETGKTNGGWLILLLVLIISTIDYVVSGKRSAIMPFLLLPLIWYHYLIKRLTMVSAGIYFLVAMLAIIGLLMARIVLPLLEQNLAPMDYIGGNLSEMVAFYIDTGEWSSFDMVAASVVRHDELLEQAGGSILGFLKYSFRTMIIFVPRAIWSGKPDYEDLSHVYYRVLIGPEEGIGIAPTIWGASYLFFNLVGLAIGMYVLGWLFKSVYGMFQPNKGRPLDVFLYSIFYWMAFQFLRFGTMGFVTIIFVQSMFIGVLALLFLGRRRYKMVAIT